MVDDTGFEPVIAEKRFGEKPQERVFLHSKSVISINILPTNLIIICNGGWYRI